MSKKHYKRLLNSKFSKNFNFSYEKIQTIIKRKNKNCIDIELKPMSKYQYKRILKNILKNTKKKNYKKKIKSICKIKQLYTVPYKKLKRSYFHFIIMYYLYNYYILKSYHY